jgi:hypothetical protein
LVKLALPFVTGPDAIEAGTNRVLELRKLCVEIKPPGDAQPFTGIVDQGKSRMRAPDIADKDFAVAHGLILRSVSVTAIVALASDAEAPALSV